MENESGKMAKSLAKTIGGISESAGIGGAQYLAAKIGVAKSIKKAA